MSTRKVWSTAAGSLVWSTGQGYGHAALHEKAHLTQHLVFKSIQKGWQKEEHNDKVIVYASGLWLSRYIYVGRSRQAQCTIQRAKAKIFREQKTCNSKSTYAQARTSCLKALHLALYSWRTSVQFRAQQEKQTIILFGVLHLSSWC